MRKELTKLRTKKEKLHTRMKAMQEELDRLSFREEELENEEIIAIFRANHITLEDLIEQAKQNKAMKRAEQHIIKEDTSNENRKDVE